MRAAASTGSSTTAEDHWVACQTCDLLSRIPPLAESQQAECPRCGTVLLRARGSAIGDTFALGIAALILFAGVQSANFMSFGFEGRVQDARILTGIAALVADGKWLLGSLIFATAFAAPLLWVLSLLYLSGPLWFGRSPPRAAAVMRCCQFAQDWSMLEVFLLAVFVTYVKLIGVAEIGLGPGAWMLAPLIFVLAAASGTFDRGIFWSRIEGVG